MCSHRYPFVINLSVTKCVYVFHPCLDNLSVQEREEHCNELVHVLGEGVKKST